MAVMSPETFCLLMAALYGGFGITMYANLTFFYGPDSIISYFTVQCEEGKFFGRVAGLLFIILTTSPYMFGADCAILCKQYLIWNVLSLLFFYQAAFSMEDTGPGANALLPFNLWLPQGAIGLSFAVLNALVVKDLPKGTGML